MILYGWGKKTTKVFGVYPQGHCSTCGNSVQSQLIRIMTWFTLFFIPVIPYRTEYFMVCPVCRQGMKLTSAEFKSDLAKLRGTDNIYSQQ